MPTPEELADQDFAKLKKPTPNPAPTGNALVDAARKRVGEQCGPNGCARFASRAMKDAGIPFSSASSSQLRRMILAAGGQETNDPQPGDLFFHKGGPTGYSHTGIYAGGGIIDSPGRTNGYVSRERKGGPGKASSFVRLPGMGAAPASNLSPEELADQDFQKLRAAKPKPSNRVPSSTTLTPEQLADQDLQQLRQAPRGVPVLPPASGSTTPEAAEQIGVQPSAFGGVFGAARQAANATASAAKKAPAKPQASKLNPYSGLTAADLNNVPRANLQALPVPLPKKPAPKPAPSKAEQAITGAEVWDWARNKNISPRGPTIDIFGTREEGDKVRDAFRQAQREGRIPLSPKVRTDAEKQQIKALDRLAGEFAVEAMPPTLLPSLTPEPGFGLGMAQANADAFRADKWRELPAWLAARGVKLTPYQQKALPSLMAWRETADRGAPASMGRAATETGLNILDIASGAVVGNALKGAGRGVRALGAGAAAGLSGGIGQGVRDIPENLTPQQRLQRAAEQAALSAPLGALPELLTPTPVPARPNRPPVAAMAQDLPQNRTMIRPRVETPPVVKDRFTTEPVPVVGPVKSAPDPDSEWLKEFVSGRPMKNPSTTPVGELFSTPAPKPKEIPPSRPPSQKPAAKPSSTPVSKDILPPKTSPTLGPSSSTSPKPKPGSPVAQEIHISSTTPNVPAPEPKASAKTSLPLEPPTVKSPTTPDPLPSSKATGLANQVQEREALQGIIRDPEKGVGRNASFFQERGKEILSKEGADYHVTLAREIAQGKRGISGDDFGVLLEGKTRLLKAVNKAKSNLDDAVETGSEVEFRQREYVQARDTLQTYLDDVQKGKGEWANAGRALQAGTDLDTGDYAEVLAEAQRVRGSALPEADEKAYTELTKQVQDLQGQLAKAEAASRKEAAVAVQEQFTRAGRVVKREKIREERDAILKEFDAIAKSVTKLNDIGSVAYEGTRFGYAAGRLALNYAKEGAVALDEVVERVIKDLKARGLDVTYEQVVDDIVEATKGTAKTKSAIQAALATLKQEARRDNQLRAEIESLREGLPREKNAATRLRKSKRIADLEKERDTLLSTVQGKDVKAQEQVKQRIVDLKTGKPSTPRTPGYASPELQALRKERDALLAAKRKFNADASRPARRATAAAKAEAKRLTELEGQIKTLEGGGTFPTKPASTPERTPQVQALLDKRDALIKAQKDAAKETARPAKEAERAAKLRAKQIATLNAQIKTLEGGAALPKATSGAAPDPEVAGLRSKRDEMSRQLAIQAQIADMERQLATGDYVIPSPRVKQVSSEIETLRAKRDVLSAQIKQRVEAGKPKNLVQRGQDVLGYARSAQTSIDISAGGRQGLLLGLAHPVSAGRAFGKQIQALGTEQAAMKAMNAITDRPNATSGVYKRTGLHLSPLDSTTSGGEEAFKRNLFPNWARFNPVRASERAYVIYLNQLRADVFDTFAKKLGGDEEALKQVANYINVASGRGAAASPKAQAALSALSDLLYSPRYGLSRAQYVIGQPLLVGKNNRARALIAADYARTLTGFAALYTLAKGAGAQIETNSNSSDFMKWRFGTQRVDPMAGLQQYMVLASRMLSGKYTSTRGNTHELGDPDYRGKAPKDKLEVGGRFLRSKLAPVPGAIASVMARQGNLSTANVATDFVGKPLSVGKLIGGAYLPLTPNEIYEEAAKDGWTEKDWRALMNFIGTSVSDFDEGARKPPPQPGKPKLEDFLPVNLPGKK